MSKHPKIVHAAALVAHCTTVRGPSRRPRSERVGISRPSCTPVTANRRRLGQLAPGVVLGALLDESESRGACELRLAATLTPSRWPSRNMPPNVIRDKPNKRSACSSKLSSPQLGGCLLCRVIPVLARVLGHVETPSVRPPWTRGCIGQANENCRSQRARHVTRKCAGVIRGCLSADVDQESVSYDKAPWWCMGTEATLARRSGTTTVCAVRGVLRGA